jgi:hypothetical protein
VLCVTQALIYLGCEIISFYDIKMFDAPFHHFEALEIEMYNNSIFRFDKHEPGSARMVSCISISTPT